MDDVEETKQRIFSVIESTKTGVSDEELGMRLNLKDPSIKLRALNALLNEKKIRAVSNKNKMFYELIVEEKSTEDLVLDVIKEAGKNGIWIRDIRAKTKLSQIAVNKALKSLENKKSIKGMKAISNRKVYVLYDLQPDESITGGAFYDAGYIREDVVTNLKSTCFQHFYDIFQNSYDGIIKNLQSENNDSFSTQLAQNKIYASANDVYNLFKEKKSFQGIKLVDIENILNILFYECKLLKIEIGDKKLFRYNPLNREKLGLFYSPCMTCHLFKNCKPSSFNLSPENCEYIHFEQF